MVKTGIINRGFQLDPCVKTDCIGIYMETFKKWMYKLRYGADPFKGYTFTQPFIGLITQPPGEYVKPLPKDTND